MKSLTTAISPDVCFTASDDPVDSRAAGPVQRLRGDLDTRAAHDVRHAVDARLPDGCRAGWTASLPA